MRKSVFRVHHKRNMSTFPVVSDDQKGFLKSILPRNGIMKHVTSVYLLCREAFWKMKYEEEN